MICSWKGHVPLKDGYYGEGPRANKHQYSWKFHIMFHGKKSSNNSWSFGWYWCKAVDKDDLLLLEIHVSQLVPADFCPTVQYIGYCGPNTVTVEKRRLIKGALKKKKNSDDDSWCSLPTPKQRFGHGKPNLQKPLCQGTACHHRSLGDQWNLAKKNLRKISCVAWIGTFRKFLWNVSGWFRLFPTNPVCLFNWRISLWRISIYFFFPEKNDLKSIELWKVYRKNRKFGEKKVLASVGKVSYPTKTHSFAAE